MVVKTLKDGQDRIVAQEAYAYDRHGNRTAKKVWQTKDKEVNFLWKYDSDGTLLWNLDPLQNQTRWKYNHSLRNGLGQQVQCRQSTDPLGRIIQEGDDAFYRIVRTNIMDNDKQVACTIYDYDAAGNLIKESADVTRDEAHLRDYTIRRTYNKRGWLSSETEVEQKKTTYFAYDPMGRVWSRTKPDGVKLYYQYDGLGRLNAKASTDGSIAYAYSNDMHGNPYETSDAINQITQKRSYDLLNRLRQEEVSPGVVLKYDYDALGRLTEMILPDSSRVAYEYDVFHLKNVKRFDAAGQLMYACGCPDYDMQGNLIKSMEN